jgi:hypothetical protein
VHMVVTLKQAKHRNMLYDIANLFLHFLEIQQP